MTLDLVATGKQDQLFCVPPGVSGQSPGTSLGWRSLMLRRDILAKVLKLLLFQLVHLQQLISEQLLSKDISLILILFLYTGQEHFSGE